MHAGERVPARTCVRRQARSVDEVGIPALGVGDSVHGVSDGVPERRGSRAGETPDRNLAPQPLCLPKSCSPSSSGVVELIEEAEPDAKQIIALVKGARS